MTAYVILWWEPGGGGSPRIHGVSMSAEEAMAAADELREFKGMRWHGDWLWLGARGRDHWSPRPRQAVRDAIPKDVVRAGHLICIGIEAYDVRGDA